MEERAGERRSGIAHQPSESVTCLHEPTPIARRLRRNQTDEEKELWRALKAERFAGFKFRRQHPKGN